MSLSLINPPAYCFEVSITSIGPNTLSVKETIDIDSKVTHTGWIEINGKKVATILGRSNVQTFLNRYDVEYSINYKRLDLAQKIFMNLIKKENPA